MSTDTGIDLSDVSQRENERSHPTGLDFADKLRCYVHHLDERLACPRTNTHEKPGLQLQRDLMEATASKLEDLEGECLSLEVERDELRALLRDYEAESLERERKAESRRDAQEVFNIPDFLPQELTL